MTQTWRRWSKGPGPWVPVAFLMGIAAAGYFLSGAPEEDAGAVRLAAQRVLIDRDCADFSTHAQAQRFFRSQGAGDPHRLDGDDDGLACEALP